MLDEEFIVVPDWCTQAELIEILNDTSWANNLDDVL
jgi:hypothetical protein